nr:uncharacterized protein LOC117222451 [Megalopta genalis]
MAAVAIHSGKPEDEVVSGVVVPGSHWRLLKEWKPKSEVWWLLHGDKMIGGMCVVNALLINTIFRNKLKLHHKGSMTTNFFASTGPMFLGSGFYKSFITRDIILHKQSCTLCSLMKGNLLTLCAGLLFPLATLPALNIGMAANLGLRVPHPTEWKELVRFGWNTLKPAMKHLTVMLIFSSITASLVTYQQIRSINNVVKIIMDMDQYNREHGVDQLTE